MIPDRLQYFLDDFWDDQTCDKIWTLGSRIYYKNNSRHTKYGNLFEHIIVISLKLKFCKFWKVCVPVLQKYCLELLMFWKLKFWNLKILKLKVWKFQVRNPQYPLTFRLPPLHPTTCQIMDQEFTSNEVSAGPPCGSTTAADLGYRLLFSSHRSCNCCSAICC